METSTLINYAGIDDNWIMSTLEMRNFLTGREQKITTALNEIKRIYDSNDRRVEFVKNKYNIFYGLYNYNKFEEYYECNFCYKYQSLLTARWKLLNILKTDAFEYIKIDTDVFLIKLSNQEILYIYNNEHVKHMATFHFENIQQFYAWAKSDEQYHFIFELTFFRNFIKKNRNIVL